jgi:hypothetical protein
LSTTGPFLRPHKKNCKQRTQDVRLNSSQNLLHSGFCSIRPNQKSSYFQRDGKGSYFQCDEKRVPRVPTCNVTKRVASVPSFNVTKIEFQEFLLSIWSKESPKEFVVSTWPKELQEFQESYFHSGITSSSYDRPKSAICWVSSRELKRTSESRGHLYEKNTLANRDHCNFHQPQRRIHIHHQQTKLEPNAKKHKIATKLQTEFQKIQLTTTQDWRSPRELAKR